MPEGKTGERMVFDGDARSTERLLKWGDRNDIGMCADYTPGENCKCCGSYVAPLLKYRGLSIHTDKTGWLELEIGDAIVISEDGNLQIEHFAAAGKGEIK